MARPRVVDRIADCVLRDIHGGRWPPGTSIPAVRELAGAYGVSTRTAMAALKRAADEGLLRIRSRRPPIVLPNACRRAGELLAERASLVSTRRIAILVSDSHWPPPRNVFYAGLCETIVQEASRRHMQARPVLWPASQRLEVAKSLQHSGFAAAVFIGFSHSYLDAVYMLHERRFPLVIFNRPLPGLFVSTVTIDDYTAVRSLAENLTSLGHRNMCLVMNPAHMYGGHAVRQGFPGGRSFGWMEYLNEQRLLDECSLPTHIPWPPGQPIYNRAFMKVWNSSERPTALVFGHSPYAREFLLDPRFAGLDVPGEISLASFESERTLPCVPHCPHMTTIDMDHQRVAQCMIEMVERNLSGKTDQPIIRTPMRISLTESIGAAPHPVATDSE